MDNHPLESLMRSTMENLRDMIDVNTVIGEAVLTKEGTTIIPISKVSFGFASGGSEFLTQCSNNITNPPFGGGSGAGVCVKPVGFLVITDDNIRVLSVDQDNTYDKIVDTIPQIIDMFSSLNKKKKGFCEEQ
ncbi:GerW family sporulation protein [Clostridium sp.]|uniref:GerW family sporulation protein n=1 Tax=Clostridium sp. TaxID=1506 RepID=UPI003463CB12